MAIKQPKALTLTTTLKAAALFPLLPVLLVWLWAALQPQMALQLADNKLFWSHAGLLLWLFLPLLFAQALLSWLHLQQSPSRLTKSLVLLLWVAGMLVYPTLMVLTNLAPAVSFSYWLLAAGLSLLYWLHFFYQRNYQLSYQHKLQQGARSRWQWLLSLDAVLILLLLTWTIAWSLLLVSHPPGFAGQPIPIQIDGQRLWQHPGLFLSYLCQFSVLAATMWLCYWLNRYWLIRRILAHYGLLPFVLVSLTLMLLSYPLLSALLLQLPMNQVAVPALPGGGPNPFDWYNFNFMLFQWLFTTPLILAFDRQQQESRLAHIQHQQIQTELLLLQQQINPHFLFNTLNNLYALCLMKSDSAPTLILQLADLLRYVVYQGQQSRVTLQQELRYLRDYLALQQLRVSNKTRLEISFPDDVSQLQSPPLLLPPLLLIMLVENAYKHGVENSTEPSWIRLSAEVKGQKLYFRCDNSRPASATATSDGCLGLDNLRRRLQLYYGTEFMLQSQPDGANWRAELQLNLEAG
ncbi:histidine kinase [Rheinheimera riviphila]|uniref:Histidine kinase n=1 Tax=Rheinheimera riviphila TaxID=1834037 RepID=A0A437R0A7_9GAMM|nr:histidine kinase [Rheinheimera riviphila]RVU40153.1 histidine kinase [Rheinheimera riviphila]